MKPEKLTIRNIGPFRGMHTIDFSSLGDIFLIYGKTGAGKTTIFDAISYAFYSEAPGSRKGIARSMRSHFAPDNEESAVELEFSISLNKYRIRRTIAFEKLGVRSGKLQNTPEEVSLENFRAGSWQDISSTNKSETDRKILDLIGLSQEEFSRIVLLPQGEFARFLGLGSTDRKIALSKLFPVEQYTRVTELARARARDAMTRITETEDNIASLQKKFSNGSYAADRENLEREIGALRAAQSGLRSRLGEKTAELEKARAAESKRAQHARLTEKIRELEERLPEIESQKTILTASRRAAPLAVRLANLTALEKRLSLLSGEIPELADELETLKTNIERLESKEDEFDGKKKEKDALLLGKEKLRMAVDIAQSLEATRASLEETQGKIRTIKKELASFKTAEGELSARLADVESLASALDERTKESSIARDELERKKLLKTLSDDCERERKAIGAHTAAVAHAKEAAAKNARDREIAKAELDALTAEADKTQKTETAAGLASLLEEGKPCPVCGSKSHPAPAVKKETDAFSIAERIDANSRRIEHLDSEARTLEKELASREANLATADERLRTLGGSSITECHDAEVLTPDEASRAVQEASHAMQEASDALNKSRSAWREREETRKKKTELESATSKRKDEMAELDKTAAGLKTEIAHKTDRYREAFPERIKNDRAEADAIPDSAEASEALELCASRILVIEAEIETRETELKDQRIKRSALEGKKTELERSIREIEGEKRDAAKAFASACTTASFPDADEVAKAIRTDEEQSLIESRIEAFETEYADAKTRLEQTRQELALWNGTDAASLIADIAKLDAGITESGLELETKASALSALDSLKKQWDSLETERADRSRDGSRMATLANDLTGINPANTSFDAWILGMYLEEITAYANIRLEKMSEGRYLIRLNDSYRKNGGLAGLELEILDAFTGKARPSGTLSGGETFMTSISLALGLADSIQSRSGGVQLDAVFIDEGFGSLDEASLERAITILDEIRGSRMVGIISHVADLKNRIPNRVEVIKTAGGSLIRQE